MTPAQIIQKEFLKFQQSTRTHTKKTIAYEKSCILRWTQLNKYKAAWCVQVFPWKTQTKYKILISRNDLMHALLDKHFQTSTTTLLNHKSSWIWVYCLRLLYIAWLICQWWSCCWCCWLCRCVLLKQRNARTFETSSLTQVFYPRCRGINLNIVNG